MAGAIIAFAGVMVVAAIVAVLAAWPRAERRHRQQLPRQLALGRLEDAMGRVQQDEADSDGQAEAG